MYYLCDPGGKECVKSPPVGKPWFESVPQVFDDELQALERVTWNQSQRQLPTEVIDLVTKANALVQEMTKLENENERDSKKRRLMTSTDSTSRGRGGGAGGKESDGSGDDGKESPQLAANKQGKISINQQQNQKSTQRRNSQRCFEKKESKMPKETKNRSKQLPNEPVFLFRISVRKSLRGGKGNKKEWSRYCGSVGGLIQAETEACILSRVPKIPWVLFGRTPVYDT